MKIIRAFIFGYAVLAIIIFSSCGKILHVENPRDQLTTDEVFSDSASALAALLDIYGSFDRAIDPKLSRYMAVYTDILTSTNLANADELDFEHSTVSPSNSINLTIWRSFYNIIYKCNDLIANLNRSDLISPSLANHFVSEAKFLRAFAYFYLINIYGNIPLLLTTDVNQNRLASQSDSATIYGQILQDLHDAANNLSESYRGSGRVRANKWAAIAMLARVYLFQQEWKEAEANANLIINSGLYTPLETAEKVFLANSKGAILQFWTQYGYAAGSLFLLPSGGGLKYPITNQLISSFEKNDLRKCLWTKSISITVGDSSMTYFYPYKYHNSSPNTSNPEYLMALRISEQYLIRSEARARQGNLSGARSDLNIVRERASLSPIKAQTQLELIEAIIRERNVEEFTEWGQRFLTLKRVGQLNRIMESYKPSWRNAALVLPIPENEMIRDPNLTQNNGY